MNKTGKIKQTDISQDFRQFQVNAIGENDVGKYYMLSVFGEDSNIPENTKALMAGSKNKDVNFIVGVLNKLKTDDLNPGDKIIFSSSEDGSEIKSYIKLLNDGTMHFNGEADNIAGFAKLKEGFDKLKTDFNNLVTKYNAHMHPTASNGPPSTSTQPGTSSAASIDDSKKDNLKIE
jgi:hypothetical protein